MADPLHELRVLKTQLRELRWTTQADSLKTLARASGRGPGTRGGISKATIGNIINPDNPTMPRWETYEIFIDTCLRLIDKAGVEPPAGGGDRRTWRLRYIRTRDALGEHSGLNDVVDDAAAEEPATVGESAVAEDDSVRAEVGSAVRQRRRSRRPLWLTAATVLVVVLVVVGWQVRDDEEPEPRSARAEPQSSFCAELGGRLMVEDSFDNTDTGWPHTAGHTEYVSGAYRLTAVAGTQIVHAIAPVPASTNTCMEAVVRLESGLGGVGLTCRGEPGLFARRYLFTVSSTGHWGISMGQPAESRVAVLAAQDRLAGLHVDQATRIGASCRTTIDGADLVISVNGHRLRYLDTQSPLPSGTLGVVGWTWLMDPGASSSSLIEEIRIWELPSG
ncbi:hypothetical protein [Nocardia altamirensis]|uniref:hypothetical protein n=1 Tax=Nocardia altamirensis TaxID=472158 RepID=UPI000840788C|nr:hypothetical protein [Nocardia altamirensis]